MPTRRAWYLNLDAEAELARPGAVNPTAATAARCRALAARLTELVGDDPWWVPGDAPPRLDRGFVGHAWCPTPSALRAMARAGVTVPEAPPWEVLRAANHRALSASLAASLGCALPGQRFARTEDELRAALASTSPTGAWLLKRALSHHGNGRMVVSGPLDAAQSRWARASLGDGGLSVEPLVERVEDHGLHGLLARDGALTRGALTRQAVDARGQWCASEPADEASLSDAERASLDGAFQRVADALRAMGYHGPFGVDAFRWRDASGRARYHPLCEVNARYAMGWAVGMRGRYSR